MICLGTAEPGRVIFSLTCEELGRIIGRQASLAPREVGETVDVPSMTDRMELALEEQGTSPVISCGIAQFLYQALRLGRLEELS